MLNNVDCIAVLGRAQESQPFLGSPVSKHHVSMQCLVHAQGGGFSLCLSFAASSTRSGLTTRSASKFLKMQTKQQVVPMWLWIKLCSSTDWWEKAPQPSIACGVCRRIPVLTPVPCHLCRVWVEWLRNLLKFHSLRMSYSNRKSKRR